MRRLLLPLVLLATLLPAGTAGAVGSFPVTSTADDGAGSLRAAIEAANASPGADSIPIGITGTIALGTALPPATESVGIYGPGAANLTIERKAGASAFRILTFADYSVVRDVTISGGLASVGAGILNEVDRLTLIGVVVTGNEARAEGGSQAVARGGGVATLGPLTVLESTIHGNNAVAQGGSSETTASGGGIYTAGSLTLERSTVSGNSAMTPAGGDGGAAGGGVQAEGVDITSATITGNSVAGEAFATASNLVSPSGTARNTIVSNPAGEGESCFGIISSDGFNLDEDGSCEFDEGSDLNGVAAGLDPALKDNGGPTPTHALLEGSIAIDRGNSFGASTDQRGLPRPADFPAISNKEGGDGSDIGAFELQVPPDAVTLPAAPILVGTEPGDRTPPQTRIVSGPARVGYERKAEFRFNSSEAQSSFKCKLDKKKWKKCRSPYKLQVKPGKHLFKVRAIDRFGNADPSPARFSWRVKPVG